MYSFDVWTFFQCVRAVAVIYTTNIRHPTYQLFTDIPNNAIETLRTHNTHIMRSNIYVYIYIHYKRRFILCCDIWCGHYHRAASSSIARIVRLFYDMFVGQRERERNPSVSYAHNVVLMLFLSGELNFFRYFNLVRGKTKKNLENRMFVWGLDNKSIDIPIVGRWFTRSHR